MRQRNKKNTWLPPYVYLKKGRYVLVTYDKDTQRQREHRLCDGSATKAEVWQAYEAKVGLATNTLRWLAEEFHTSPAFRALAPLTRRDYELCRTQVLATPTNQGLLTGDLPLSFWTPGAVRKLTDKRAETAPSRANHELRWLRRVFSWGLERDKVEVNPARGVKVVKETPKRRYANDEVYDRVIAHAKANTRAPYLWAFAELAMLCRMRKSEVLDLTEANALPEGLLVRRRKGSRDTIVSWTPRLLDAWHAALAARREAVKRRRLVEQIAPGLRYVFVGTDGQRMPESSLDSVWQRMMTSMIEGGLITREERFGLHDLKRKGVTDTKGNRADKQQASGHRAAGMMDVYDVLPATVEPAKG